jgi:hypothetical protein
MLTLKQWINHRLEKVANDPAWVPIATGAFVGAGTAKASNKLIKMVEKGMNAGKSRKVEIRRVPALKAAALGAAAGLALHLSKKKLNLIRYKDAK